MKLEFDRDTVVITLATASRFTKGRPGIGIEEGQSMKITGLLDD